MTILSATYANAGHDAVIVQTEGRGAVLVNTDEDSAALSKWVADGGVIAPYETPAPAPPELTREAFCVALIKAGILTETEAEFAALGGWPPKFEPALVGKDLVEKLTIKNIWRETKTVSRNAPLFLDLLVFYAAAKGMTKAKAKELGDAIFAEAA